MKSYLLFIALASSMALGLALKPPPALAAGAAQQVQRSSEAQPTAQAPRHLLRVFPAPAVGVKPRVGVHYLKPGQTVTRSSTVQGGFAK